MSVSIVKHVESTANIGCLEMLKVDFSVSFSRIRCYGGKVQVIEA